jgi:hypothetical protein
VAAPFSGWFTDQRQRRAYQGRHQRGNMPPPTYGRGRTRAKYGPEGKPARTRSQLADRRPSYGVPESPRTHEVPGPYRAFGGAYRPGPGIAPVGQPRGWFG